MPVRRFFGMIIMVVTFQPKGTKIGTRLIPPSVHPEFIKEFVAGFLLPYMMIGLFPSVQKGLARRQKHA
jgi:hypothetical protein